MCIRDRAVPDAIAKRIVSQEIIPEFKNNMYYRGLDRGVDAIMRAAAGEYQACLLYTSRCV